MYTAAALAKKYLSYYIRSENGRGHGVHSPFVFDFIIHVLNDKKKYDCYPVIEQLRRELLRNSQRIRVEDFGAGSAVIPYKERRIKDIAASSLKSKKYAQLLFRVARYYSCMHILELGTSFGITTCYLASAATEGKVFTFEGAENIAAIAQQNIRRCGLANVQMIKGNFSETLEASLAGVPQPDLVFIDGNHRKEATLYYMDILLRKRHNRSVFIFDDIHWSRGMEEAWESIKAHPEVTMTIDLFFIGLVFFDTGFRATQHFSIRF